MSIEIRGENSLINTSNKYMLFDWQWKAIDIGHIFCNCYKALNNVDNIGNALVGDLAT